MFNVMIIRLLGAVFAMNTAFTVAEHKTLDSVLTAPFTPSSPANPTGDHFKAGYFVMGYFTLTVTSCNRATCTVQIAHNGSSNASVRFYASATAPTMAQCNAALTLPAAPGTLVLTATSPFPKSQRVYLCYANLDWNDTPIAAISPAATVKFTMTQSS